MAKLKADQKPKALAVTISGKGEGSVRCRGATLPKNCRLVALSALMLGTLLAAAHLEEFARTLTSRL